MINWKDPNIELPENSRNVWVIYQHNKEHRYLSSEIMCGEAKYSNDRTSCIVDSMDFTGKGSWCIYLTESPSPYDEQGIAWCYTNELLMPDFIPHDKWWGEICHKSK